MRKILVLAVLVALAGTWLFSQYWYYLPAVISAWKEPVGENRPVNFQQGPSEPAERAGRPNLLLIVADDLGWNDITFYGGGAAAGTVPTPNIDSIAAAGVHFSNGYAGNGTCAPSRAALLTGRFSTRVGFEFTPAPPEFARLVAGEHFIAENARNYPELNDLGLPGDEVTLPELLKARGYHSVALGKWHLGGSEGTRPNDQGFDEFLGFLPGGALFLPKNDPGVVNSRQSFDPIDKYLWANLFYAVRYNQEHRFAPDSHMTDYLSRQAVQVIRANRNRPFFLYLAYNAPHTPLQAEKADYDALAHIENHTERTYAAMLRGLDRGIGQVLQALKDEGLARNTLVVFTSDNGAAGYLGLPDLNKPWRGWKITFFEGGIHVPYFMRWPDRITPGSHYSGAAAHIDIFSTLAAAAGAELPADRIVDGVNLLPFALGETRKRLARPLYWRSGGYKTLLQSGWKLHLQEQTGKTWLFNLAEDRTEQRNLSESHPVQLAGMRRLLEVMDNQMAEPLWPPLTATPIAVDYTIDKLPEEGDYETVIWSN